MKSRGVLPTDATQAKVAAAYINYYGITGDKRFIYPSVVRHLNILHLQS